MTETLIRISDMEYGKLREALLGCRHKYLTVTPEHFDRASSFSIGDGVFIVAFTAQHENVISCGHISGFTMNLLGEAVLIIDVIENPYVTKYADKLCDNIVKNMVHCSNVVNWKHISQDGFHAIQKLAHDNRPTKFED
jgi:superoxide dismutase